MEESAFTLKTHNFVFDSTMSGEPNSPVEIRSRNSTAAEDNRDDIVEVHGNASSPAVRTYISTLEADMTQFVPATIVATYGKEGNVTLTDITRSQNECKDQEYASASAKKWSLMEQIQGLPRELFLVGPPCVVAIIAVLAMYAPLVLIVLCTLGVICHLASYLFKYLEKQNRHEMIERRNQMQLNALKHTDENKKLAVLELTNKANANIEVQAKTIVQLTNIKKEMHAATQDTNKALLEIRTEGELKMKQIENNGQISKEEIIKARDESIAKISAQTTVQRSTLEKEIVQEQEAAKIKLKTLEEETARQLKQIALDTEKSIADTQERRKELQLRFETEQGNAQRQHEQTMNRDNQHELTEREKNALQNTKEVRHDEFEMMKHQKSQETEQVKIQEQEKTRRGKWFG